MISESMENVVLPIIIGCYYVEKGELPCYDTAIICRSHTFDNDNIGNKNLGISPENAMLIMTEMMALVST